MLISKQFEETVNNFNWITGIIVLLILLVCNYLSPDNLSSLTLKIKAVPNSDANLKNIKNVLETNLTKQDLYLYFGQDIEYQNSIIKQLKNDLEKGIIDNNTLTINVEYNQSAEEGENADEIKIVKFIKTILGENYSVFASINNASGISFGLAAAILVNFVMDGLLIGNEIKYSKNQSGFVRSGYLKLNNVFGFIFDNLILMLILGFQFSQSSLSNIKQSIYLLLIVLSFVASMFLGMFTRISTDINKSIADTIVFVVIAYTILIELIPESTVFKDYYGREIEIENSEDPYMLVHDSFYIKNYKKAIMPILLFVVFFLYKIITGFLE